MHLWSWSVRNDYRRRVGGWGLGSFYTVAGVLCTRRSDIIESYLCKRDSTALGRLLGLALNFFLYKSFLSTVDQFFLFSFFFSHCFFNVSFFFTFHTFPKIINFYSARVMQQNISTRVEQPWNFCELSFNGPAIRPAAAATDPRPTSNTAWDTNWRLYSRSLHPYSTLVHKQQTLNYKFCHRIRLRVHVHTFSTPHNVPWNLISSSDCRISISTYERTATLSLLFPRFSSTRVTNSSVSDARRGTIRYIYLF